MPLIPCPECKNEVSDHADVCPQCGFRIKDFQTNGWDLDRLVQLAQISLPIVITTALAIMGQKFNARMHEDEQNQLKASTAIKVVELLVQKETREEAGELAFSLLEEGQLHPSMINVLAIAAAEGEIGDGLRKSFSSRIGHINSNIEEDSRSSFAFDPEVRDAIRLANIKLNPEEEDQFTDNEDKEQAIEAGITALKEGAASDLTIIHTRKTLFADASRTTPEPDQKKGTPEAATTVSDELAKISEDALKQVATTLKEPSENEQDNGNAARKEEFRNDAIRKTNALVQGVIEAKKEARADPGESAESDTLKGNVKKTADEVVKNVLEQSLKELPGEENIELRDKLFEGTGITRLVVVVHNNDENEIARAKEIAEHASKLLKERLRQHDEDAEVVSAIDYLWLVEKEVEKTKQLPFQNVMRYLKDESDITRKRTANYMAEQLKQGENAFHLVPEPRDSGVAEGEFEIWVMDSDGE